MNMKKYVEPYIDVLDFDDDDDVITMSGDLNKASYAAQDLNEYMFSDSVKAGSTTTININRVVEQTSE